VRLPHRDSIPDHVRRALPLLEGERPLVGAVDELGRWYVGTTSGLFVPDGSTYRRIRWEAIERGEWDSDGGQLVVEEVADFGRPMPRHSARLEDAGRLLQLIRERVTASVVLTRYVPVAGNRGISVVGRRAPGAVGPVEWSFVVDPSLSPDDPRVRGAAERALAEAEYELGS
jgi:hypothetical protein